MVKAEDFGALPNGRRSTRFILENRNGMRVTVCDIGAAIVSVCLPSENGEPVDVVLGLESPEAYMKQRANMGVIVGRHAGRIGNGTFILNAECYCLTRNSGRNHIHGGTEHFGKRLWHGDIQGDGVRLQYVSHDGEEGYPGELTIDVLYTLDDNNRLTMEVEAKTEIHDTILNITNHSYFNLAGHCNGGGDLQDLQINADYYAAIDHEKKPTGVILPVKDTPFDFTCTKSICRDIDSQDEQIQFGGGYDHNFLLRKQERDTRSLAARLTDPYSGRYLEVETTLPCLQLYSANHLDGTEPGKEGARYPYRSGVCLEVQGYPNAMECTHFPSPILRVGEVFRHTTVYAFGSTK